MLSVLLGVGISLLAAAPAWLLMWGGRSGDARQRLKLWAIGLGIRFAVIGAALYILFTQTGVDRVPVVIGVAVSYMILYVFEIRTTLRS